ncbi:MAG: Rdx family protein [Pirellulaceae bacterium]|nr:Rdx family protein [Pirellulaceae bacterium]
MAAKILTQFKRQVQSLELEPSVGGCFELRAGDDLLYSKLATGEFPDERKMVDEIGRRMKKKVA